MRRHATLLALLALLVAAPAHAGGANVSVAATSRHVWVATGIDVVELDARTGRVEHRYRARYPYTLSLGLSRGAVWVTSVESGFTAGAVTRIPLERGPIEHPLIRPTESVLSLAVGGATTWALIGPWAATQLAAISQTNGRVTLKPLRGIGGIAADDTGLTPGLYAVTAAHYVVRLLATGGSTAWTSSIGPIESPPLVALGSVWVESSSRLYRLDATTGRTQAAVQLHGDAAFLTSGDGRIWVISLRHHGGRLTYELLEIDPRRNRVVNRAALALPIGAVAYGAGALWIAEAGFSVALVRVDPGSLEAHTFATGLDNNLVPIQSR